MVSMGRDGFVVNSQQDVPEVLNYLLDNFCGISVLSQDQIKVVIRNRITCTNQISEIGYQISLVDIDFFLITEAMHPPTSSDP